MVILNFDPTINHSTLRYCHIKGEVYQVTYEKTNEFYKNNLTYLYVIPYLRNQGGFFKRIGYDRLLNITSHDYEHLLPLASDYLGSNSLVPTILK